MAVSRIFSTVAAPASDSTVNHHFARLDIMFANYGHAYRYRGGEYAYAYILSWGAEPHFSFLNCGSVSINHYVSP